MQVKNIKLSSFRNYKDAHIVLNNGLNVLVGKNAQGKTNLLESVYFASLGLSPRTTRDKDLIKWEESLARVKVEISRREGARTLEIILPDTGKKTIKINNIPIKRMGELMGELPIVYFSPDELRLVKEGPQDRRKFLDIDISQLSKVYFYSLQRYLKTLSQRNALLKQKGNKQTTQQTITIWNDSLSKAGANIILARHQFVNELKQQAAIIHKRITNNKEVLEVGYSGLQGTTTLELTEKLLKAYEQTFDRDFELGFTTVGPHRDDLKLFINDIDVRSFGSQGQQRTAALSLKLAELEIFKAQNGEYPVLLLDDVLSELDELRAQQLLDSIKGIQTILTCTEFNFKPKNECVVFEVQNGNVLKQK